MQNQKPYIIIGASAAGIAAAQKMRQLDLLNPIICISDEEQMPYNKCMLADYVSGIKQQSEVFTLTAQTAATKNINLILGKKVVAINASDKSISLDDGQLLHYHKLLLAVGTSPAMPPIEGAKNTAGVFTFHRLRDMQDILKYIQDNSVRSAVIIGSGLSGLEAADALNTLGVQVSVVEMRNRVLSSHLDESGSDFLYQAMAASHTMLHTQKQVNKISQINGRASGVLLNDGTQIEAQLVIVAIGLQPNIELANQLDLKQGDQGILIDDQMMTSIDDIYAAGDICMVKDQLSGNLVPSRTWPDAMLAGLIAACNMAGQPRVYPGISTVISSAFFGLKFAACGPLEGPGATIINATSEHYHRFLVENGALKGFLLVGNTSKLGQLRQAVLTKSQVKPDLINS